VNKKRDRYKHRKRKDFQTPGKSDFGGSLQTGKDIPFTYAQACNHEKSKQHPVHHLKIRLRKLTKIHMTMPLKLTGEDAKEPANRWLRGSAIDSKAFVTRSRLFFRPRLDNKFDERDTQNTIHTHKHTHTHTNHMLLEKRILTETGKTINRNKQQEWGNAIDWGRVIITRRRWNIAVLPGGCRLQLEYVLRTVYYV